MPPNEAPPRSLESLALAARNAASLARRGSEEEAAAWSEAAAFYEAAAACGADTPEAVSCWRIAAVSCYAQARRHDRARGLALAYLRDPLAGDVAWAATASVLRSFACVEEEPLDVEAILRRHADGSTSRAEVHADLAALAGEVASLRRQGGARRSGPGRPFFFEHDTPEGQMVFCAFPDRSRPLVNAAGEVTGYRAEVWPVDGSHDVPVWFDVEDDAEPPAGEAARMRSISFRNVAYPEELDW